MTEVERRSIEGAQNLEGAAGPPVARHAEGDERVVVRPDGAAVIAERVVGGVLGAERANAPSRPQLSRQERRSDAARTLAGDGSAEEQMTRVRGTRGNALSGAVDGKHAGTALVEVQLVDRFSQLRGALLGAPRGVIAAELAEQAGGALEPVDGISLHLDE